jgi:SET domain-containing protein
MFGFEGSVYIGPSTYGQGVFARRRLRRGECIGRVAGEVLFDLEEGSEYSIDLSDGRLLEPAEPFCFLNHSCEPTCELINYTPDDAEPHEYEVVVRARRTLQPGQELTIDYAWSAEAAIECGCQSARCRGWIVSPEELEQIIAERGPGSRANALGA